MASVVAPLVVVVPLRLFRFPDTTVITLLVLAPLTEEILKFATVLVVLDVLVLARPARPSRRRRVRWRILATPWIVGGAYGLYEGLVLYPADSRVDLALRVAAHAAFVSLTFGVALTVWSRRLPPGAGAGAGLLSALAAHAAFNAFVYAGDYVTVYVSEQIAYTEAVLALAAILLYRASVREPRSTPARRLLSPVTWRRRVRA